MPSPSVLAGERRRRLFQSLGRHASFRIGKRDWKFQLFDLVCTARGGGCCCWLRFSFYFKKKAACSFHTAFANTFYGPVLIHKFNIRFPPSDTHTHQRAHAALARANHKFCAGPEFISVHLNSLSAHVALARE
jgi:hypothetical protein